MSYGSWEVACPECGEKRFLKAHKYKNGKIRGEEHHCHGCRAVNLSKRVEVKCPSCSKVRLLKKSDATQRLSQFCVRCVKGHSRRGFRQNGHRINITSRGYVLVLGHGKHPVANKNSVLEHWLTLYNEHPMGHESVLWFKKQGFTLHHKNGNRQDNSLNNLELRAPGKHPAGWTINDMREVIHRYDGLGSTLTHSD